MLEKLIFIIILFNIIDTKNKKMRQYIIIAILTVFIHFICKKKIKEKKMKSKKGLFLTFF